jgi:hypothetical protein
LQQALITDNHVVFIKGFSVFFALFKEFLRHVCNTWDIGVEKPLPGLLGYFVNSNHFFPPYSKLVYKTPVLSAPLPLATF